MFDPVRTPEQRFSPPGNSSARPAKATLPQRATWRKAVRTMAAGVIFILCIAPVAATMLLDHGGHQASVHHLGGPALL